MCESWGDETLWRNENVGKGSRQNRSVTLGKGLALRVCRAGIGSRASRRGLAEAATSKPDLFDESSERNFGVFRCFSVFRGRRRSAARRLTIT